MASSRYLTGLRARSAARSRFATRCASSGSTCAQACTTGEVERLHGEKPRGIAVHIGARIASCAGRGEVLVTATTCDLVAGSGLEFEDRGTHQLKGFRNRGTCSTSHDDQDGGPIR